MIRAQRMKIVPRVLLVLLFAGLTGGVLMLVWPTPSEPLEVDATIADSGLPMFLQKSVDEVSSDYGRQIGAPTSDYEMMRQAADAAARSGRD